MALISAEEFKKNKGKTTTSPSSGLISADEFKRQKIQQSAQRIQDTASAISSAASAVGDFIGGAWDSFRQSAQERSAQPVTPSPSSPVSHDDIKSGRVQIQPTGSLGAVDPNLRPDTSPRTIQEELAKRQSDRANILPDNALGQFAQNIYREADRFLLENPIGAFITRFGQQGAAALGQAPMHELPSTGSRAADVAADVGGTLASLAVNPGGVTSIAPGQASILGQTYQNPAVQMAATAAGARFSNPTASRIASEAVREGITGAVEGGAMALARGGTERDALRDAAIGGAFGGALGGAVPFISDGVRAAFNSLRGRNNAPSEAIEEILALPAPRQRGNQNSIVTPEEIIALPEPRQRGNQNSIVTPEIIEMSPSREYPIETSGIVQSRSDVKKLPEMRDNYLKPLNEYTNTLYRETSPDNAVELIPGSNKISDYTLSELYFSNKPELALGQGNNKGVLIEFDSGNIKGQVNTSKPSWKLEYDQGNAEFIGRLNPQKTYQDAVRSVTIRPDAKVNRVTRIILQRLLSDWDKRTNPDGSITYSRNQNITRHPEIDRRLQSVETTNPFQPQAIQESVEQVSQTNAPQRTQNVADEFTSGQTTQVDNEFLQIAEEATHPRIRDRVYNYLDEAEQAARERIAKRRNRLSANPIDEWGDYAIIMAAKVGKGTIKLADFTEELVREFGESVRPYANQILRRTKEELRKQTRRATKEADEAIRFNDQPIGNADTFRSKIDRSPRRNRQSFSQKWEQVRSQFIDDLAPLEGLEKRVRGDLASAEDSLYKAARLFKGVPSKANNIVQTRLAPIAQMVQQAGHTMEDLGDYALAMHARDVNASYMKSGFTNAEINDVIQKLGTPELEAARQQLVQLSNEMLNELVDAQVISRELADTLMERWPNYVPLFRSFDDDVVQFESGLSQALANVASPIKTLKGSERRVVDPIENVIKNVFRSVNAAERNRVALQLARLAEETGAEGLIRRLDPNEKVGRKNVVNVKMNGENVKFEVEPEVYKAMLNLDQESSTSLIRFLSKPASLLRAGATLTPEFSLRNPMRDIVQAFVVSESGFNPLIDFPVGLIETIRGRKGNSQLYTQWINDLGDFGNIMSMDRKVHREAMNKVLKQSPSRQFVNIINPASWIRLLRAISDTTESATKLGEYRAALRSGASRQEAAYRSRDIMDFARAGSSIRQWNKIVAFLNANIQGKSKILRAIKKNPVGVITRGFTSITLPTIAAFVMQKYFANETQQNTIEEAPDWMKDTFWLVPIPGTDTVARIPKPFDLSPIFSNLPERTLEYVYNNDKEAFDGFVRRSLGDMALPVQITGLWPFVEGMANYSWFRESQIIPMREQNLEYRDQFDPVRTSETARLLARGAEAITGGEGTFANFSSPRIMENTIQGLTAGLGRYATDAIDAILKGMGTSDRPEAPERRLEQQPFLRAFTVDPMQSSKTLDKFYSQKEKLTNARNSARINERPFENEQEYRILNQAGNVISDINKSIRTIESSDLTPREKRQRIEELQKQRLTIARRALEQLERVQ